GGVAPRTAQAAMRHSGIKLTMNVYTDPAVLDVRGALDVLPSLPLAGDLGRRETMQATGTDGNEARTLAPTLAPTTDNSGQPPSNCVRSNTDGHSATFAASADAVKGKGRLSSADNRPSYRGDWIRTSDLLNPI